MGDCWTSRSYMRITQRFLRQGSMERTPAAKSDGASAPVRGAETDSVPNMAMYGVEPAGALAEQSCSVPCR